MRNMGLFALLALAASLAVAQGSSMPPSSRRPQFIVFTHDDGVAKRDTNVVLSITNKHKNPNGCRMPVTWFACTKGCSGFSCATAKALYHSGHEVADHTITHRDLRALPKSVIRQEISGARDTIAKCGIPKAAIKGFRAPYLSDKPEVRQVLSELGFKYDSTITARGGAHRQFPARLNKGIPYDCSVGGRLCAPGEKYPHLWEVPLYELPDRNSMDPCTNEANGKPDPGCDPFKVMRQSFDNAYAGNRGPVMVPTHTPYLRTSNYSSRIDRFLGYALGKKDVWAVTISQLLDWMERPVPASQMRQFMAKYKCQK